jgi:hypothetical protein
MAENDMPLLGEINTWQRPVARKQLDPDADASYLVQEVITERYIYDSIGKGPYKGVVLRVEESFGEKGNDHDHPDDHPEGYMYKGTNGKPAILYRLRVRIPEIHASLPIPKCLPSPGTGAHPEDGIINLYPVFVSERPELDKPLQGQIVWVDYRDKENFEKPIYKGLVDGAVTLKLSCGEETPAQSSFARSRDCVGLAVEAPAGAAFGTSCSKTRIVDSEGVSRTSFYGEPTHDHNGILVEEEAVDQMPSATAPDRCVEDNTAGTPTTMDEVNGNGTTTDDGGIVDEDLDKWDIVAATVVGEVGAKTTSESDLHTKRCVLWTIRNRMKVDPKKDTDRKAADGTLIRRGYDAKNDVRGIVLRMAQYSLWNSMNRGKDFSANVDPAFGDRSNKSENRHGPHFGRGEDSRALTQSDIVRHAKEQTESANPGGWQIITNLAKEIIPESGSDSDWSAVVSDSESPFKVNGKSQPVGNYYNPNTDPNWGKWEKYGDGSGKYYQDVVENSATGANMRSGPAPGHNPGWVDVPVKGQTVYHRHRYGLQGKFKFRA